MYSYKWTISSKQKEPFIEIEFTTQANPKDLFMEMLLHLNQDFDDDLLQDSIELIVDWVLTDHIINTR